MQDTIKTLFGYAFKLTIQEEISGQASIIVTHPESKQSLKQMLPVDHHLDQSLKGCVNYCIEELRKRLKGIKEGTIKPEEE